MKTISMGELRQNPAQMAKDLEQGVPYSLTVHNRPIGTIIPIVPSSVVIPPRKRGRAHTSSLPRHELRTASSIDELLDEQRGEW